MEFDITATMIQILMFPWWKNTDFLWNNILIVEYFHGTNMINFCGLHLLKIQQQQFAMSPARFIFIMKSRIRMF